MFKEDDLILCGSSGVYRVDAIGPLLHMRGYDPNKDYYTLVALNNGSTSYAPVDGPLFMRPVISRDEAFTLLEDAKEIQPVIYKTHGPYALKAHYQAVFAEHDCRKLIAVIKGIEEKRHSSKKFGVFEYEYKKKAERLLAEELSAALQIRYDEALERLHAAIQA